MLAGLLLHISGKVQGVGFRPLVWQLAKRMQLSGNVLNDGSGVEIKLLKPVAVQALIDAIRQECPPLAQIEAITQREFSWLEKPQGFAIINSQQGEISTRVVPDAATCPHCLAEMRNPQDRHARSPFINCTHCGPRYSLLQRLPYDRKNTAMSAFALCPACEKEYQSPVDRRFHAQPVCCPHCGPELFSCLQDGQPQAVGDAALQQAVTALGEGKIVALKSIGGFHLVCDASNSEAVARLRQRKNRPDKPLAVMLPASSDLSQYTRYQDIASLTALLSSAQAPIVLVPQSDKSPLSPLIAPHLDEIGLMLPANPLQHLLLDAIQRPLVMTSGNAANHAPALANQHALSQLATIADLWLLHNRDIVQRVDDSLLRLTAHGTETLRRARGYVPDVLPLPPGFNQRMSLLALGGDLKNTFCLLDQHSAMVSQHFGSLHGLDVQQQWQQNLQHCLTLFDCQPDAVVRDAHPGYYTHQWAADSGLPVIDVLHHHAHLAAVLAEHQWPKDQGPVIGLVLDGIGYGPDGALWGGECLLADYRDCRHLGGLPAVALPGGDLAATQPWRNLLAQWQAFCPDWQQRPEAAILQTQNWQPLANAIRGGINAPLASSCGRLFDAVACALGCATQTTSWEGQAACRLEALAQRARQKVHQVTLPLIAGTSGSKLNMRVFWQQWLDWQAPDCERAWAFHDALAQGLADMVHYHARHQQIHQVALGGGVMHNALLRERLHHYLSPLTVFTPQQFPAGDGGLALGQALIACARRSVDSSPETGSHHD